MGLLLQPLPWGQQPQVAARVDTCNALGRRLVYASTLGPDLMDAVTGAFPTVVQNVPARAGWRGRGRECVAANSPRISLPSRDLVAGYPLTVACWVRPDDLSSGVVYSLNGTFYSAIIGLLSNYWCVNTDSASGFMSVAAKTGLQHLVCVHRSGSFDLWIDGVKKSQTAVDHLGQPPAGNHSVGCRVSGPSLRYFTGLIQDLLVFNGELSAAEIASLYSNHWQVFAPPRMAIGAVPASGSSYTLEAIGLAVASGSATASVAIPLAAAGVAQAGGSAGGEIAITLGAAGLAEAAGAAGLDVAAVLAAVGAGQASGAAVLNLSITLAAAGAAQAGGSATLSGGAPGELSASGGASASGAAAAVVQVAITAAGLAQAIGSGSFTVSVPLSAFGIASASGAATLAVASPMDDTPLRLLSSLGRVATLAHRVSRV